MEDSTLEILFTAAVDAVHNGKKDELLVLSLYIQQNPLKVCFSIYFFYLLHIIHVTFNLYLYIDIGFIGNH
jgi:hypothetical protein